MAKKQVYDYALGKFVDAKDETQNKQTSVYDPTTGTFRSQINNNTTGTQQNTYTKPASTSKSGSTSSTTTQKKHTTVTATPAVAAAPDYSAYAYDPSANTAYINAMSALEKAKAELPQYAGTYDAQLDDLYQQIVGRDKFGYDLNEDMFYQQAADRAMQMGNMAMMDTMGQAASLTGGYGNTYAQNVGQQAYQGYIQQLNDNIPQFYQMALDAYNAEGDKMMQQYGLLGDLANREYSQYQDELANYWQNIGHLQGIADTEYGRGYENWYNAQQLGTSQQNANYDRLVSMMTTMGYQPSAQEVANAGLTGDQAQAFMDYYAAQNAPKSSRVPGNPVGYDSLVKNTTDAIKNGSLLYTEASTLLEAAAKEGVITESQKQSALNDCKEAVKERNRNGVNYV